MRKKYNLVLILLCVSFISNAQSDIGFHSNKFEKQKGTYEDVSEPIFDIENTSIYTLRRNPAFFDLYYNKADSTLHNFKMKKVDVKNILAGTFLYDKADGNYIYYEGTRRSEGNILAGGEIVIDGLGTLFGSASYSSEKKKDVALNYATNPLDYYPYMVSDTLGTGDISSEKYRIDGGFSFRYKGTYYGVGGSYEGIAASKLTDPRLSVYTSWFRLNFGAAKVINNNLYSLKIYPELNKQNISANNYAERSAKYFQFYGFGAWNRNESSTAPSYGRQMTIWGIGTDLTYKKLLSKEDALDYMFNVVYNYRVMDTEEDSYKNLFTTHTHHFKPELVLSKKIGSFDLFMVLTSENEIRTGTEHVYENLKASEVQDNLYDYKKVASSDMYHQNSYANRISAKAIYNLSPFQSLHLKGGIGHSYYEEKYSSPQKRICNQSIIPSIGIGYNRIFDKNSLELNAIFSAKKATDNVFDLPSLTEQEVVSQAYLPYLIRGEDSNTFSSEIVYSRSIGNGQEIGSKLSVVYTQRTDAPYIEQLKAVAEQDRQSLRCKFNIFYIF